jgi:hypothetical protein
MRITLLCALQIKSIKSATPKTAFTHLGNDSLVLPHEKTVGSLKVCNGTQKGVKQNGHNRQFTRRISGLVQTIARIRGPQDYCNAIRRPYNAKRISDG